MLTVTDHHKTQRTAEADGNVTGLSGIWSQTKVFDLME